jgi:hypothetical protein
MLSSPGKSAKRVFALDDRAIQYFVASRFISNNSGILDHPLSRVMTASG